MINTIKKRIQSTSPLKKEALDEFVNCINIIDMPAKQLLFKKGKTAKKLVTTQVSNTEF